VTGDSLNPEQPPSGPLYARQSASTPIAGTWRGTGGPSGPQAGAQRLEGGDVISCPERCVVPEGVQLAQVPRPRHAWSDVLNCPNDGCERSFLANPTGDPS
jgi:hypothetical protein